MEQKVKEKVKHFQRLKAIAPAVLFSVQPFIIFMAEGGSPREGTEQDMIEDHYNGWSVNDFQALCDALGWEYEK